ncbi:dimethylamine monooxygenase subunit DmmA family protein [Fictibacillus terranigra]|uniref:Dimethylamine monooxygenase subunit DmmA family protein n=1 Tax=Fictibacillus terranigra TaxID=3058424 RepID=A0ABT8EAV7_9BACL|nr:dimethylamine monooxygenase subunit DmmA family protein [Fictibacillus sp. CENA-BCM004]MDN4075062.1 dimethylamine monooxygenase subunit DmmA family protein [Fictibacillus sp. CENA-BCM004]
MTFVPGKRKYLICGDPSGINLVQPIIQNIMEQHLSFEVMEIKDEEKVRNWLDHQKMGCYLYVSAAWPEIERLKNITEDIGFSEEEVQFLGRGEQMIKVFCCRCHGLTELARSDASEITCSQCGLLLSVSDHYSSLRKAYLGYVAKL